MATSWFCLILKWFLSYLLILTSSKPIFWSVPTKCSGMSVHNHAHLCIYMYMYIFNKCRQASKSGYLHAQFNIQFVLYQEMSQIKWRLLTKYLLHFEDCWIFNYLILIVLCDQVLVVAVLQWLKIAVSL